MKTTYPHTVITIFVLLFICFCTKNSYAQYPLSDHLNKVLPDSLKPKDVKNVTLDELVRILKNPYTFEKDSLQNAELFQLCYQIGNDYVTISDQHKRVETLFWMCFYIGRFNTDFKADSLGKYLDKLLPEAKAAKAWNRYKTALSLKSVWYKWHIRYLDAYNCMLEAMSLPDTFSVTRISIFANVVQTFQMLQLPRIALAYNDSSRRYFIRSDPAMQTKLIPTTFANRAYCYIQLYQQEKAGQYADSARAYIDSVHATGAKSWETLAYTYAAILAYRQQHYAAALKYIDTALLPQYTHVDFDYGEECRLQTIKGLCLIGLKQTEAGEKVLLDNENCFQPEFKDELYHSLYEIEKRKGHFAEALHWQDKYTAYRDTLDRLDLQARVFEANQKYDVAKKEAAIIQINGEKKQQSTLIIALLLVLVLLGIIFFIVYRANKQKLKTSLKQINDITELQIFKIEEAAARAKEQQRLELGAELHNLMASSLSATKLFLDNKSQLETNDEEKPAWKMYSKSLNEMYMQVRSKSHNLFNAAREPDAFVDELKKHIALFFSQTSINVTMDMDDPELGYINPEAKVCLLHIIKEGMTNIIKYADANKVDVFMYTDSGRVHFFLADDGHGMPENRKSKGIGLASLQQRVEGLRGQFVVTSSKDGTTLKAILPV